MRTLLFALAALGCGDNLAVPPAGAPPPEIALDIVVTPTSVQIDTDGTDYGTCVCSPEPFPQPGACTFLTDAGPCPGSCPSCFTDVEVTADGVPIVTQGGWPVRTFDPPPGAQLALVLAGCGRDATTIALGDSPMPMPQLATSTDAAGHPVLTWTADRPWASAVATIVDVHGDMCHVVGTDHYVFADWGSSNSLRANVITLAPQRSFYSAFGPTRIWRGGGAYADFPGP